MKLSIIVPCKNEENNIKELYKKISDTLKDIKYEILFIDDGSVDKTMEKLRKLYEEDIQHVKVLSFSRNFMKEAAMLAGLEHASGEYTCIIDADLQQNPKYLVEMYQFLEEHKNYDEVAMVMQNKNHTSKLMNVGKDTFYKLMNQLCDIKLENAASDFRMFRSNVKEAILRLSEKTRFTKGIFAWVGFHVKYLPYEVEPRVNGKSSFGFKNSFSYALLGIQSFSNKPLKIATKIGFLTLFSSFIYFIVLLVQIFGFHMEFQPIYALIFLLLFLFGIQFILIGIVGAYLANINNEVRNRPVYIIKEKIGFQEKGIL